MRIVNLSHLALFIFLVAGTRPADAAHPRALVLRHVNVVPMTDERVVEDVSVVVVDGRIEAIGGDESVRTPKGALEVDGRGRYLMPGLVEMHVHLRKRLSLDLFLGHGVTFARNMDGTEQVLDWRDEIAAGTLLGPHLTSGSPYLHRHAEGSPERHVASVEDAVRLTRLYDDRGYDYIKIAELDDEPFYALMEEARHRGIPVVGHIPNYDLALERIFAERMTSIEHLEELFRVYFDYQPDESRIAAFVETVRRSGVPISTLIGTEEVKNGLFEERRGYLTPERLAWIDRYGGPQAVERIHGTLGAIENGDWQRQWVDIDFLLRLVAELHAAGVVLVPGTDSGGSFLISGLGLHHELDLFRRAGLTPYEALRTATVNAATVLGLAHSKGTVEMGKDADLILLAENPLVEPETAREPVGMVLAGRWLDAETLAELRARTFEVGARASAEP
jgi:imidazolonepropionase-like amidohydrolase